MNIEKHQHDNLATSTDEIDLMELFLKIWEGKLIIIGTVLLSSLIAFVALKFCTSYYRIEAIIDMTTDDQLRPIAPSFLKGPDTQIFSTDDKKKSVEYQISYPDARKIYDRVTYQVGSISAMKAFWEKQKGVSLNLSQDAVETPEIKKFRKFYEKLSLEPSNPKTPDVTARKISLEYPSSSEGVELLGQYIKFLNTYVWLNHLHTLETAYNANIKALDNSYSAWDQIEQRRLNDRIISLRESLKVAESLGIRETPYKELENIQLKVLDGKEYLLGTKPISQQIDIYTSRQGKSLAPFSYELRNLEIWKDQLNSDLGRLKSIDNDLQLFSLVNSPESSLDPVKPKKVIIFIAVVLLSAALGICIVLIRSAVQWRSKF